MRHFHWYSQVFLALLFLVEASASAQTIRPVTKSQPQVDSALVQQPNKGPIKAMPAGRSDPYNGYKFLIRSGNSTVAGFSEYTEIGNASRPSSGKSGAAGGSQVPVTVPGSLVGSNGSVTLNCTPSNSNGPNSGVSGKAVPRNDDWTITLTCAIPFDKVTLQRGVTVDPDFAGWIGSPSGKSRDLTVEAVNQGSNASLGYRLSSCTVASAKTMPNPEVAAGAHGTNIADLELHCAAVQRY